MIRVLWWPRSRGETQTPGTWKATFLVKNGKVLVTDCHRWRWPQSENFEGHDEDEERRKKILKTVRRQTEEGCLTHSAPSDSPSFPFQTLLKSCSTLPRRYLVPLFPSSLVGLVFFISDKQEDTAQSSERAGVVVKRSQTRPRLALSLSFLFFYLCYVYCSTTRWEWDDISTATTLNKVTYFKRLATTGIHPSVNGRPRDVENPELQTTVLWLFWMSVHQFVWRSVMPVAIEMQKRGVWRHSKWCRKNWSSLRTALSALWLWPMVERVHCPCLFLFESCCHLLVWFSNVLQLIFRQSFFIFPHSETWEMWRNTNPVALVFEHTTATNHVLFSESIIQ